MSDSSLVIHDLMTTATNYAKTLTSTTINAVPLTCLTCSRVQGVPFNRPLSVLLDSGSTTSWVNRNTLPSFISPTTVTSLQGMTMAGNFQSNQQLTLTSVALPELSEQSVPTLNLCVFNSSCRYDIILGHDALTLFAITIDFDMGKVIGCDSCTIPLCPFRHEANMSSFNIGIFLAMDHFEALLTECMISENDDTLTSDPPIDPCASSSPPEKKKQKCAIKDSLYEKDDPSQIAASCTHLDIDQKQKLAKLLSKYPVLFNGELNVYPHQQLHLDIDPFIIPHVCCAYPIPRMQLNTFKKELDRLVKIGVLEKQGRSAWQSETFIIPKKDKPVCWISDF